jgi:diaminopropionate ammonia-lyase
MAGLNCGRLATSAWPLLHTGLDAAVAIDEERCGEAVRLLARHDVVAGECGAAGLGGLLALQHDSEADELRRALCLDSASRILLLSTEGVTNPASYRCWLEG